MRRVFKRRRRASPAEFNALRWCSSLAVLAWLLVHPGLLHAQTSPEGSVTAIVTDPSAHGPLENASIVVRSPSDSTRVAGTTTGKDGRFTLTRLPLGAYFLECTLIGHVSFRS